MIDSLMIRRLRRFRRGRRSQDFLHQAGEVEAQNALAVAAAPHGILRVKIVEVDAAAVAHDLQPLTASLNQLRIVASNGILHNTPSLRYYQPRRTAEILRCAQDDSRHGFLSRFLGTRHGPLSTAFLPL